MRAWFAEAAGEGHGAKRGQPAESLISAQALARALPKILGDGQLFPALTERLFPALPEHGEGQLFPAPPEHCRARGAEHCCRMVGATLARRGCAASDRRRGPFTLAEVTEALWDVFAARYLDGAAARRKHRRLLKPTTQDCLDQRCFERAGAAVLEAIYGSPALAAVYLEPLSSELVVDHIVESCGDALGSQADIDKTLLHELVAGACITFEPSLFLAKTLLRSAIPDEVFGCSLAARVRRACFLRDWDIGPEGYVCDNAAAAQDAALLRELLGLRSQFIRVKQAVAAGDLARAREVSGLPVSGCLRVDLARARGRHSEHAEFRQRAFAACDVLLEFNGLFKQLPGILASSGRFNAPDPASELALSHALANIASDRNLRRMIPLLDIAVEELVKVQIAEASPRLID